MYIFFYTLRSFDTINIFDRIFYHPDLIVQRHYVPHLELSYVAGAHKKLQYSQLVGSKRVPSIQISTWLWSVMVLG